MQVRVNVNVEGKTYNGLLVLRSDAFAGFAFAVIDIRVDAASTSMLVAGVSERVGLASESVGLGSGLATRDFGCPVETAEQNGKLGMVGPRGAVEIGGLDGTLGGSLETGELDGMLSGSAFDTGEPDGAPASLGSALAILNGALGGALEAGKLDSALSGALEMGELDGALVILGSVFDMGEPDGARVLLGSVLAILNGTLGGALEAGRTGRCTRRAPRCVGYRRHCDRHAG